MMSDLLNNDCVPNYDELLNDIDLSPHFSLSNKLDKQIKYLMNKLKQLGYSKEFAVKVAGEAMRRYDAAMEEFLKTTRAERDNE